MIIHDVITTVQRREGNLRPGGRWLQTLGTLGPLGLALRNEPSSRARMDDSLTHPRTPASIGVYRGSLSRLEDYGGHSCTVIRNPEKRKAVVPSRP
jgi:hypothetical protein